MKPTEIIKVKFRSLMEEYGYSIKWELYSPEIMGNAVVVFVSNTTGIKIVIDRNQVFATIGDTSQPEDEWFELSDVVHFYAPTLEHVNYFQKNLPDSHNIEPQLDWLIHILHLYCESVLRGDFANASQIKDLERRRVEEMLEHFNKQSNQGQNKI